MVRLKIKDIYTNSAWFYPTFASNKKKKKINKSVASFARLRGLLYIFLFLSTPYCVTKCKSSYNKPFPLKLNGTWQWDRSTDRYAPPFDRQFQSLDNSPSGTTNLKKTLLENKIPILPPTLPPSFDLNQPNLSEPDPEQPPRRKKDRPLVYSHVLSPFWNVNVWTGSSRCPQVPKRWANWKSTWACWNWRGCREARASECNRRARSPARGFTRVWTLFISWYWSGASSRSWTGNGPGRPGPRRTARASSDFASRGQSLLWAQPRLPRCLLPPRRDAATPRCSSEQRNARVNVPTNIARSLPVDKVVSFVRSNRSCWNLARATASIRAQFSKDFGPKILIPELRDVEEMPLHSTRSRRSMRSRFKDEVRMTRLGIWNRCFFFFFSTPF